MKIAYFNGAFKKEDGVTVVIVNLCEQATKRGIESVIVTTKPEDPSIVSVPIISAPSIPFPLDTDYRVALPGMYGFETELDKFRPDIIHMHSPDTIAWAAVAYGKKNGIPVVATHHTDFISDMSYFNLGSMAKFGWHLLKKIYAKAMVVTTPSLATKKDLNDHGISNVVALGWGINQERFNTSHRSDAWRTMIFEKYGSQRKHIIFSASRMTWVKDLKVLAEIHDKLGAKRDDFITVIAGDGPNKKDLEKLMPTAIFLGHLDGTDLSEAYASSDVFLFPSSRETFGNVTIESVGCGVPPVVANAGGSASLVADGVTGLIAKPKDSDDFVKKVERLLDDPEYRKKLSDGAVAFAKENTWDKVFDKLLGIYQEKIEELSRDIKKPLA